MAILWMAMSFYASASDPEIEPERNVHQPLVASRISDYNQYLASGLNEAMGLKAVKAGVAGTIAVTSTSYLLFLGRDLTDDLIGVHGPGYVVGTVAMAPIGFIVFDLTTKKLNQFLRNFNPDWQEIRQFGAGTRTGEITYEVAGHAISLLPSMVGIYYSNLYWRPLIGAGVWVILVPTLLGKTIIGHGALDALYQFAKGISQRYICRCRLSEETRTRLRVEGLIDNLIAEVKGYSQDQVNAMLAGIRRANFSQLLHAAGGAEETCGKAVVRNSLGISGCIIGLVGSYAIIAATKTGVKWVLTAGFGVDPDTADTVGTVSGYFGGFITGAIRGLGARNTFQTLYGYFSKCCGRDGATLGKKQVATDIVSGGLSLVASSSRIKIILDTNIADPTLKVIVIGASLVATSATDFYGLKGFLDGIFHGAASKQSLINLLNVMKSDLSKLRPSLLAELGTALARRQNINGGDAEGDV